VIAQRLSSTLEKLQRPQTESDQIVPVEAWWDSLRQQYLQNGVEFEAQSIQAEAMLPRALAESVADNLIQNALTKRLLDPEVRVRVAVNCASTFEFRVCDTGRAIGGGLEKQLFHAPVGSHVGLGIGLYQAARHAEANGFELSLASNRDGHVCFLLEGTPRFPEQD
jgi:signal transduction histidine kinase